MPHYESTLEPRGEPTGSTPANVSGRKWLATRSSERSEERRVEAPTGIAAPCSRTACPSGLRLCRSLPSALPSSLVVNRPVQLRPTCLEENGLPPVDPSVARSEGWRRRPDLNRCSRFCRPVPNHSATAPLESRQRYESTFPKSRATTPRNPSLQTECFGRRGETRRTGVAGLLRRAPARLALRDADPCLTTCPP